DMYAGEQLMQKILNDEPFELSGTGSAVATEDGEPADHGEDVASEPTEEVAPDASDDTATEDAPTDTEGSDGSGEGEGTGTAEDNTLPENVTGQKASTETCSAGRTSY